MKNNNYHPTTTIGLQLGLVFPLLALLFTVLKLYEIIDWSWWLVLSPMIFHAVGILLFLLSIGLLSLAAMLYLLGGTMKRFTETLKEKSNDNA
jgi:hypothetical protein